MPRFRSETPRPCTIFCFALIHYALMNYVTNTFLLVSSSVRSKQLLCFVHGQGQKREQKPTTKKFVGFPNHSLLLTMILANYGHIIFSELSSPAKLSILLINEVKKNIFTNVESDSGHVY